MPNQPEPAATHSGRRALFARLAAHPVPRISRMMTVARMRGLDPLFVGGLREAGLRRVDEWDGFEVRRVGPLHESLNGRGLGRYLSGTLAFNVALLRTIRRERPALVHLSDFEAALFGVIYCRLARIPVIYNVHDNIGDRYALPLAARRLLAVLEGMLVVLSDTALVPEEFRRDALPRWSRRKVSVVRNAPEDLWPDGPPAPPPMTGRLRLLYAGWIDEGRGVRTLIRLAEENPWLDVRVAGSGDPALVGELESSAAVSYLGYLNHAEVMQQVVESHAVVALYDPVRPINIMAAPNKLAESFCAGRPVVINSEVLIGAAPEYQDAVVRTAYDDRAGLVEALRRLRDDDDRYREMCAVARSSYEAYYSWRSVVEASSTSFAAVGF